MIYRSPFPGKPKELAAKKKLQETILKERRKRGKESSDMVVEIPGDAAFILGNGRREAIQKRLRHLRAHKKALLAAEKTE